LFWKSQRATTINNGARSAKAQHISSLRRGHYAKRPKITGFSYKFVIKSAFFARNAHNFVKQNKNRALERSESTTKLSTQNHATEASSGGYRQFSCRMSGFRPHIRG
jgi:hypothetical protein